MTVPSTLGDIRAKVRRLTGSPNLTQLTDAEIDENINTYYSYDMPQQLKLFNLKEEYQFYTQPNIDTYDFPRNEFRTVSPPLYIAGYESFWSQSRDQFYRTYPQLEFLEEVSSGDGTVGPYTFTLTNIPCLRGYTAPGNPTIFSQVLITGVDGSGGNRIARDDGAGGWIDEDEDLLLGTIDYVTGDVTVSFSSVITGTITAQNIPYVSARPQGMLFFNDLFFLRPVPDQTYKVEMDVYRTPTALISVGTSPELNEWWQYLSFGAASKILEDRLDTDGLSKIRPLLEEQQRLVLRRTLVQQSVERTATIYEGQTQFATNNQFNQYK